MRIAHDEQSPRQQKTFKQRYMAVLQTTLIREKFVIKPEETAPANAKIALSNRMTIPLLDAQGRVIEHFVVRTQNMHQTVRIAAHIFDEYRRKGPIEKRFNEKLWTELCNTATDRFEHKHNDHFWIIIYHNGEPIFTKGKNHPLLDIIEKCAHDHPDDYEHAHKIAADTFSKSAQEVIIEYDGNIALTVDLQRHNARFGIILRTADRTATFRLTIKKRDDDPVPFNHMQCLLCAASYLEGIQLAFTTGMNKIKLIYGHIDAGSKTAQSIIDSEKRIKKMETEIQVLENSYAVNYRPEKPIFSLFINNAENLAAEIFEPIENEDENESGHRTLIT